jgi:hypothetical protein
VDLDGGREVIWIIEKVFASFILGMGVKEVDDRYTFLSDVCPEELKRQVVGPSVPHIL